MTNFETLFYWFGITAFWFGITYLTLDNRHYLKRAKNKLIFYLIKKKSQYFGTWCVVAKRIYWYDETKLVETELKYLTKFFATRANRKIDNHVRTSWPSVKSYAWCSINKRHFVSGFMYKKKGVIK